MKTVGSPFFNRVIQQFYFDLFRTNVFNEYVSLSVCLRLLFIMFIVTVT